MLLLPAEDEKQQTNIRKLLESGLCGIPGSVCPSRGGGGGEKEGGGYKIPAVSILGFKNVHHPPFPRENGCSFFAYSWKRPAYNGALLLTVDNFSFFAYNWSFFAYSSCFFAYNWSFFA